MPCIWDFPGMLWVPAAARAVLWCELGWALGVWILKAFAGVTLEKRLQSSALPSFKLPTCFIFEEPLRKCCPHKTRSQMPEPLWSSKVKIGFKAMLDGRSMSPKARCHTYCISRRPQHPP